MHKTFKSHAPDFTTRDGGKGREHFTETNVFQFYIMQYNIPANACHVWCLNICAEK